MVELRYGYGSDGSCDDTVVAAVLFRGHSDAE